MFIHIYIDFNYVADILNMQWTRARLGGVISSQCFLIFLAIPWEIPLFGIISAPTGNIWLIGKYKMHHTVFDYRYFILICPRISG